MVRLPVTVARTFSGIPHPIGDEDDSLRRDPVWGEHGLVRYATAQGMAWPFVMSHPLFLAPPFVVTGLLTAAALSAAAPDPDGGSSKKQDAPA